MTTHEHGFDPERVQHARDKINQVACQLTVPKLTEDKLP